MKTPSVAASFFSSQVAACVKTGLLGLLLAVPGFAANVSLTPATRTFQGNLPLVDSYVLTIKTPLIWTGLPLTSYPISLTVTPTAYPASSNATAALSYITLSTTTLSFDAANQSKSVLVSCNFPAGIPVDSAYTYKIDTSGWPTGTTNPAAGATISASLTQPPGSAIAPSVVINTPAHLASFTANSFPYDVTLNYTATGNGGNDLNAEDATLTGFNPDGSISSSVPVSLTQLTGQTITGTANLSIPTAGTYEVRVNVHNGLDATAVSRFTVVPNAPPPTVAITSPVNGSAFTFYASAGALSIPMVFSGSSTLINITSLVATLDGLPFSFAPSGINTPLAVGSASQAYTSVLPSTHTLSVTAVDLRGQSATTTSTFTINIFAMTWPAPAAINYGTALSSTQLNATVSLTGPNGPLAIPGTITYSPAAGAVLPAGVQTLSATFTPDDLSKYQVVTQTVPLTVNKVPLTVTAASATKVYGTANPSFSATIGGFVNGDTAAVVTGNASIASSATAASAVGNYSITPALGTLAASNYTFTFVSGTLSVTKAPLTVTADNKTKSAGAANPTFTATISGFVNNDTAASSVTGSPAFSTTANTASPAGAYPITPSLGTLASANYAFPTFVAGTLTVTAKLDQTITFGPLASKVVGSAPFTLTATASSGLAVSYTSSNPSVATVSGSTVTIIAAGVTIITASQPGNATYNAAPSVLQSFTVTPLQNVKKTISGMVFFDVDYDGVLDSNEFGLGGISIKLRSSNCHVVASDVTEADGTYSLPEIAPGTYTLEACAPTGFSATTLDERTVTVGSSDVTVPNIGYGLNFCAIGNLKSSAMSQGFWKNNVSKALAGKPTGTQVSAATVAAHTTEISALALSPFDGLTMSGAKSIFNGRSQLQLQLLAAEYNYVHGFYINGNEALTFAFIYWGEVVMKNASGTYNSYYQNFAANWFEAYNTSEGGRIDGPSH